MTSAMLASDERDNFYALVGIVHDGRNFIPTPDYKISLDDLKAKMATMYLRATKNLDVIIAAGKYQVLDRSVPSWVPNWAELAPEADYAFRGASEEHFTASGTSTFISNSSASDDA